MVELRTAAKGNDVKRSAGSLITFFTASVYQYQFRLWRLTRPLCSSAPGVSLRSAVEKRLVDCVTLMPSITPSFPILGPFGVGWNGIKARKSSVSKMNGSGIDDAESAGGREGEYRKICR